jgi:hypothetical protein
LRQARDSFSFALGTRSCPTCPPCTTPTWSPKPVEHMHRGPAPLPRPVAKLGRWDNVPKNNGTLSLRRSAIVPHRGPFLPGSESNIKISNITSKFGLASALQHAEMCARWRASCPLCTQRVTPSALRWEREVVPVVRRVQRPPLHGARHLSSVAVDGLELALGLPIFPLRT